MEEEKTRGGQADRALHALGRQTSSRHEMRDFLVPIRLVSHYIYARTLIASLPPPTKRSSGSFLVRGHHLSVRRRRGWAQRGDPPTTYPRGPGVLSVSQIRNPPPQEEGRKSSFSVGSVCCVCVVLAVCVCAGMIGGEALRKRPKAINKVAALLQLHQRRGRRREGRDGNKKALQCRALEREGPDQKKKKDEVVEEAREMPKA